MAVTRATRASAPESRAHGARHPWVMLGVGLGAFVDGIVLHQLLQWHHMLSSTDRDVTTIAGLEANTVADGAFHLAALVVTVVGLWRLRAVADHDGLGSRRGAIAWMLIGWGAFNLVEGLVDHHVLGLHHVRDDVDDPLPWDLAFLVVSGALVAVGAALSRRSGVSRWP